MIDLVALAGFFVLCFGVAAIGSSVSTDAIQGWYREIRRPPFTPPNVVFPLAWTLLFTLMAVAAFLVWRERAHPLAGWAFLAFGAQLVLNALWSWLFFGRRSPGAALVEIVPFLGTILLTTALFHRVSPLAGWLLVPYVAWVSFATVLNFEFWRLNRSRG